MNTGLYVAWWILLNLFAVGCYDVYAFFFLDAGSSVSFWLQRWFSQFPALAVAVGFVLGHLSWPLYLKKGQ